MRHPEMPIMRHGKSGLVRDTLGLRSALLRDTLCLVFLLALAGPALAGPAAPREVGRVTALQGRAFAAVADQAPRRLDCGDAVHEGERLFTDVDARLVVQAGSGAELHLASIGVLALRRAADGSLVSDLERGGVRIRHAAEQPQGRVATPAGLEALEAADVEVVRVGPDVRICEWSHAGMAACRLIQARGRSSWLEDAGPRLPLGLADVCGWKREIRSLVTAADFAAPLPVSTGAAAAGFEPELEVEAPCSGDDCGGGTPTLPDPIEFGDGRILTVAPAPIAIPPFP